jgi:hypothetical protein
MCGVSIPDCLVTLQQLRAEVTILNKTMRDVLHNLSEHNERDAFSRLSDTFKNHS